MKIRSVRSPEGHNLIKKALVVILLLYACIAFSNPDKFACEEKYCSYVAKQISWYVEIKNKNVIDNIYE